MKVVQPQEVTPAVLDSTSVVDIETAWTAGTYNNGVRRVYERKVYEVVAATSTSDRPDLGAVADPPTWVDMGFSNTWRMFTEGVDSKSTADGEIDVTLAWDGIITTLAILGAEGRFLTVRVTDPVEGLVMDETRDLVDIGVGDWWEHFFLPYDSQESAVFALPPYSDAEIQILLEALDPANPVAIGRVIAGIARDLGITVYGTDVQLLDYSIKDRDGFGNLILRRRRTIKRVTYDVRVPTPQVDFVVSSAQRLSAVPTLYIGEADIDSTVVFGVFANFSQGISTPSFSDLTLQVEEF